ncbi:RNA polymerase sigma factor [Dictyobacter kobayashii]|uniref:DNA-directed RNA polymerase sigma-70 factor n=1 Tax=Dictyobacter kobayashii TaxID=2014872 RepID=A0A402AIN1_9CHLR|nr:sigma-70 family RNA polymerase sigma factor [Dictyobacter kobayashii]GCE18998.1 DNA-directed RNA polymerase sigma-70 factor [Dictyobacter kobayashii]
MQQYYDENIFSQSVVIQTLYENYATALFAYLRFYCPSREDAEDLLLETFLQALESTSFISLSPEKQRSWLYSVAHHKVVDRFRQKARREHIGLDLVAEAIFANDEHTPEYLALKREEYQQVLRAVQHLGVDQQEILRLRFANGLRCTEIATLLGKKEGTIRSLLSRTINLLRTTYRHLEEGTK